jgi:amino acid transporter
MLPLRAQLSVSSALTIVSAHGQGESRTIGLLGATGVGVGAIVGGGILVLGGVAFQSAGPSAIVAFAINGVLAILTALSFAEMSTAFPQSGGAYTFAKQVLSVRAAFAVGWIVWFAYIVAGVLYALGFAAFAANVIAGLFDVAGATPPDWVLDRPFVLTLALGATVSYALSLVRKSGGGGQWETIGKLVVFAFLIVAGVVVLVGRPVETITSGLRPFLPNGMSGLLAATGFTFITLQGFDLIAAVAGEVKRPERVIPRSMLYSIGIGLAVYLPLLFLVATIGVAPGESVVELSTEHPDTFMAIAVERYLGPAGYWLVMVAAILSTLSALQANLFAASRVALTMARDRTLPTVFGGMHEKRGTPVMAIYATTLALAAILMMVPDLASAGAAASLIFLISFALAHLTAYLARVREQRRAVRTSIVPGAPEPFRTRFFPFVPVVGGLACAGLAIFQGLVVPSAGYIVIVWLGLGLMLYFSLFATRAERRDAFTEGQDPRLVRLRGRSPLVLVPLANPSTAVALVELATALAPKNVGRVVLLTTMRPPAPERPVRCSAHKRPSARRSPRRSMPVTRPKRS